RPGARHPQGHARAPGLDPPRRHYRIHCQSRDAAATALGRALNGVQMRAILGLFLKRWVLSLLGLIAISLLVWFVGPLFAFASYKPLEPETARWLVIGALFAIWIGQLLWKWVKQLNANRQLLSGLAAQHTAPQSETERASAAELSDLRRRMQEALGVLKKMRVKGTLGSRYLYQLPWYIIIGAPGAGKTTALLNSGLRFPLAER